MTPALPSLNCYGLASPLSQHALGLARSPAVCFLASPGGTPAYTCENFLFPWQKCGSGRRSADPHLRSSSRLPAGGREISPCCTSFILFGFCLLQVIRGTDVAKILPINVGQSDLLGLSHRRVRRRRKGTNFDGQQPSLNPDKPLSRTETHNGSG